MRKIQFMQKSTFKFLGIYQPASITLLDGGKGNTCLVAPQMVQSISPIGRKCSVTFSSFRSIPKKVWICETEIKK